jgi:ribosome modulation factor
MKEPFYVNSTIYIAHKTGITVNQSIMIFFSSYEAGDVHCTFACEQAPMRGFQALRRTAMTRAGGKVICSYRHTLHAHWLRGWLRALQDQSGDLGDTCCNLAADTIDLQIPDIQVSCTERLVRRRRSAELTWNISTW